VCQKTVSGKVRFEFTDFGKGIPKEKLPSIWDRYYKIDSTHKRAQSGSGIGLSIVKSVLELHKANYGVISNVNSGSTFWFELPISKIVK
jgi:signal transduction histidine kinase